MKIKNLNNIVVRKDLKKNDKIIIIEKITETIKFYEIMIVEKVTKKREYVVAKYLNSEKKVILKTNIAIYEHNNENVEIVKNYNMWFNSYCEMKGLVFERFSAEQLNNALIAMNRGLIFDVYGNVINHMHNLK